MTKRVSFRRVPEWHADARRMFYDGMMPRDIARALRKQQYRVIEVVTSSEWDRLLTEKHVPRVIRQVLDRAAMPEALRAFVAGEIDRVELMRRISC